LAQLQLSALWSISAGKTNDILFGIFDISGFGYLIVDNKLACCSMVARGTQIVRQGSTNPRQVALAGMTGEIRSDSPFVVRINRAYRFWNHIAFIMHPLESQLVTD
jgi:hypothetical protein